MTYTIKLPVFEGPFDLLLHLIKVNEMDIYDIPVAEITRQYLDYVRMMQELDLELAGEFLVMAATLIHLKARTLLPVPPDQKDQEEEIDEIMSARELVRQLVEYRKYKEAAAALRKREEETGRVLFRNNIISIIPDDPEEMSVDVSLLYKAFARVLNFVETPGFNPTFTEQFSVEDKINYIQELAQKDGSIDLFGLFRRCLNKSEIVVTFLATLELCRMKRIHIRQDNPFDAISVVPFSGQLEYEPDQSQI
ncbi:MAG: segregation/condensation protein A [Candidatus Sumerlaeaceae bacterium]|nr:segregation/condensation protein A [Candidatus Sumerlaeaceae bacterium]